jgi:hypothetical protein
MITGLVDYKITGLRLKDWNEGEGWGFEMITEQKGGLAAESRKGQKKSGPQSSASR